MNYKELSDILVEISKELKKKTIGRFKRYKLKKKYNNIIKSIKLNYKGGIY